MFCINLLLYLYLEIYLTIILLVKFRLKPPLLKKQHFHLVKYLSLLTFYRFLRLYISFEFTVVTFFP